MNTMQHNSFDGVRVVWRHHALHQEGSVADSDELFAQKQVVRLSMDGIAPRRRGTTASPVSVRTSGMPARIALYTNARALEKTRVVERMRRMVEGIVTGPVPAQPASAWPYVG